MRTNLNKKFNIMMKKKFNFKIKIDSNIDLWTTFC